MPRASSSAPPGPWRGSLTILYLYLCLSPARAGARPAIDGRQGPALVSLSHGAATDLEAPRVKSAHGTASWTRRRRTGRFPRHALLLAAAALLGCAPKASSVPADAASPARAPAPTSTETAAPQTQQRVAPAPDPDPSAGPCSGYGLDGVS